MMFGRSIVHCGFGEFAFFFHLFFSFFFHISSTGCSHDNHAATLNNGTVLMVPTFVDAGTKIRVNTEEGIYVERA